MIARRDRMLDVHLTWPGRLAVTPVSPAGSTIALLGRIPATDLVTSRGTRRRGTSAVVMTMSNVLITLFSACAGLRAQRRSTRGHTPSPIALT
jgi:hypothetical protein